MTVLYFSNPMQQPVNLKTAGGVHVSCNETENYHGMSMGEGTSSRTNSANSSTKTMVKRLGKKPGRKPAKIDEKAKLERSRQSARECRARKKLRYQYLEEVMMNREKAVLALKDELETYKRWSKALDKGVVPHDLEVKLNQEVKVNSSTKPSSADDVIDFSKPTCRLFKGTET